MVRIGALISGSGTNLTAIVDSCMIGRIDGAIVVVGADNASAAGLEKARARGIDTFVVDYRQVIDAVVAGAEPAALPEDFQIQEAMGKQRLLDPRTDPAKMERFLRSRAVAEARLLACLQPYAIDLLVLAGFMRTLTPYFIDRFSPDPLNPRIMNIHPALLPAFPGADGYGDTWRYGCKVAGCTVHFVDYGEDTGPIIGQRAFSIDENASLAAMRDKGLTLEWTLYPLCIQLFAEGRLKVEENVYHGSSGESCRRKHVRILPQNE